LEASEPLGKSLGQLEAFLGGLTIRQRVLLIGGAAAVGATLWVFVGLLSKPKMATLYSGLRPADAQALESKLAAKNIAYEMSADGSSLLVASDKLDVARLETASQGLPRNARLGFELFDTPNWAGSDFTEKVNFQRALEGELERTLQTLSEVEAVRVHLVLPHESLFTEQEREAKAAVIIKTRGGRLSEQAQLAIPQLVASAVDRLRPENVTVVDAESNTPLIHPHGAGGVGAYDMDEGLAKTIVRTLEPVVGADHVRASVHIEYDLSTSEDTQETYDPKTPVAVAVQRSEENMGGGAPAGIPGTASNVPGSASGVAASVVSAESEKQSSHSESSTYAVSKDVRRTVQPSGRIHRIAAAVLVDDATEVTEQAGKKTATRRKRTADEMKEIEQLARAAIGIDAERGDLLAVENLSFQEFPAEKPEPPTSLQRSTRLVQQWSGVLRYVGIGFLFLIVYFLILQPIKKQTLATFRALPAKAKAGKDLAGETMGGAGGATTLDAIDIPQSSEAGKRAAQLKHQLAEKIKAEPAVASRLVQTWIREDKSR